LILIDNIVELILHNWCENIISIDNCYMRVREPKYSAKKRKEILGRDFENKIKFCKELKKVNLDEQNFVIICHKYRNEVYHIGIKYEEILNAISNKYHQFACTLFRRLEPLIYSYGSNDKKTDVIVKHLGNDISIFNSSKILERASDSLNLDRPNLKISMNTILHEHAVDTVVKISNWFDNVVRDNPSRMKEKEMLYHLQVVDFIQKEDARKFVIEQTGNCKLNHFDVYKWLMENWTPRFRKNPVSKWLKRAENLKNEKNDYVCMYKYNTLINDMSNFEYIVGEALSQIENYYDVG